MSMLRFENDYELIQYIKGLKVEPHVSISKMYDNKNSCGVLFCYEGEGGVRYVDGTFTTDMDFYMCELEGLRNMEKEGETFPGSVVMLKDILTKEAMAYFSNKNAYIVIDGRMIEACKGGMQSGRFTCVAHCEGIGQSIKGMVEELIYTDSHTVSYHNKIGFNTAYDNYNCQGAERCTVKEAKEYKNDFEKLRGFLDDTQIVRFLYGGSFSDFTEDVLREKYGLKEEEYDEKYKSHCDISNVDCKLICDKYVAKLEEKIKGGK